MTGSSPQGGPDAAKRLTVAERRTKAVAMRCAGKTWQQIVDAGIGYKTTGAACQDIGRAFEQERKTQSAGLEELRQLELARLDGLIAKATEVMESDHPYVFGGAVVTRPGPDELTPGEELKNSAPVLAAIDRIKALAESRRKLLGLDAQPEAGGGGTVQFYVNGVDMGKLT